MRVLATGGAAPVDAETWVYAVRDAVEAEQAGGDKVRAWRGLATLRQRVVAPGDNPLRSRHIGQRGSLLGVY